MNEIKHVYYFENLLKPNLIFDWLAETFVPIFPSNFFAGQSELNFNTNYSLHANNLHCENLA